MRKIWQAFAALFYPRLCAACQSPLGGGERCICLTCLNELPLTQFWTYPDNPAAQTFAGRFAFERACAYFYFRKGSRYQHLLHQLKYHNMPDIGTELGARLGQTLADNGWLQGIDCIVPVPLHPKKLRRRGYNQSERIAQGLSATSGLPCYTDVLVKVRATESQTRRSKAGRWNNLTGAFAVEHAQKIEGKHVLLIDDVITSGATIDACAQALLSACPCTLSIAALGYTAL